MDGVVLVACVHALTFALHVLIPVKEITGYACDCATGRPLRYRCNGFRVLMCIVAGISFLDYAGVVDASVFSSRLWSCFGASFAFGIIVSAIFYFVGKRKLRENKVDQGASCLTTNGPRSAAAKDTSDFRSRSSLEHFYCGIEWNPRPILGVDVKMYNYLVGAVLLALNLVSGLSVHLHNETCTFAMIAYASCMGWFIADYMWFEHVHVYTYDIFRERTGFKMIWGCFCFYPFFYTVGLWSVVQNDHLHDIDLLTCVAIIALFLFGWTLTRGANMQKFYWRISGANSRAFLCGIIEQRTVPGSKNRILRSGFWSLARHVRTRRRIVSNVYDGVAQNIRAHSYCYSRNDRSIISEKSCKVLRSLSPASSRRDLFFPFSTPCITSRFSYRGR